MRSLEATSWRLASVQEDGQDPVEIVLAETPPRRGAGVVFKPGGELAATDTVNHFQANYEITEAGDIVISNAGGTLAGYVGNDPSRRAARSGIHAILYTRDGQPSGNSIAVQSAADKLELAANGYTLVLREQVPG